MEVKRGEMYMANLSPVIGSEQGGERPVLILQNDRANQFSPTTVITAITSKIGKKPHLPTHIRLHSPDLPVDSMALLEQIQTIDKQRLGYYIGTLDDRDMKRVERGLLASVGMERIKYEHKRTEN
jgi:mRNA interferase MazF